MNIVFFEDNKIENLYPIALTRSPFDILCGGTNLYKASKMIFKPVGISSITRKYIQKVTQQKYSNAKRDSKKVLFLNAALVPDIGDLKKIEALILKQKNFVVKKGSRILVAYTDFSSVGTKHAWSLRAVDTIEKHLSSLKLPQKKLNIKIFENVWDVSIFNKEIISSNIDYLKKHFNEKQNGVYVGKKVVFEEDVVLNTEDGDIIIDDGAKILSQTVLRGPLYIGKKSTINSFAEIKDGSSIGEMCKIGGEVEASVVQGYSSKQHFGFLGYAYVGEWVNLGAGTTNSDLKNTYGEIKMYGQKTGQQFLGCVISDYCKTSIMTTIYTAKGIGVNGFLYGTVSRDVPSFTNHFSQCNPMVEVPIDVAQKVQKKIFERRGKKQTAVDAKLLSDVFEMTKARRKKLGVKKGRIVL